MKLSYILLLSLYSFVGICQNLTIGKGNLQNVQISASSNAHRGVNTLKQNAMLPNEKGASRFLSQATFGPNFQQILNLKSGGLEAWLDQQLALPYSSNLKNYVQTLHQSAVDSTNAKNPTGTPYTIKNYFFDDWVFDIAWFQAAMTTSEHLRWRVGYALSQIFVTSRISSFDDNPYALASYYDMLNRNAFSNYRSLIDSVTFHPAMGVYLTYLNNHATDTTNSKKVFPDENYARELMQLFSIGLYELNPNGTEKKDAQNKLIPTYSNADISGLAKVFTGLSWGDARYLGDGQKDNWSYTLKMRFFPIDSSDKYKRSWLSPSQWRIVNGHEPGSKTFLGHVVPSRPVDQGLIDISEALDVVYNHPNVGPFIAKRLIQHLVMSNPSPEYIERMTAVFNSNGSGVRGDLKALIRAILLDPEARNCCTEPLASHISGHLTEPFLRYMNLVKGLELTASGGVFRNSFNDFYNRLDQRPLASPSVFNFYSPLYVPDGPLAAAGGLQGPEFQMLNSLSLSNYMNALNDWITKNNLGEWWSIFSGEQYKAHQDPNLILTSYHNLSVNNRIKEFLDKMNLILAAGKISPRNISIIENTVKKLPLSFETNGLPNAEEADRRIRMGIFLIMLSPDYLIKK